MELHIERGFVFPILFGHQYSLRYVWTDAPVGNGPWRLNEERTTTYGFDLGRLSLRFMDDRASLFGVRSGRMGLL
jgi:hypothetical protein